MEANEVLRAPPLVLLAAEQGRCEVLAREVGARRPVREPEHPPSLAEHHQFAAVADGRARCAQYADRADPRPREQASALLETQLSETVGYDALVVSKTSGAGTHTRARRSRWSSRRRLMHNMRNPPPMAASNFRMVGISADGGRTYSGPIAEDRTLIEPPAQASMVRCGRGGWRRRTGPRTRRAPRSDSACPSPARYPSTSPSCP